MVHVFHIRDILRIYHMHRSGIILDLEHALTEGYVPWQVAVRSWLRKSARTYLTFAPEIGWHILQLLRRSERPEWDIMFLSPEPSTEGTHLTPWQELLQRALRDALYGGTYRVYATPPADTPSDILLRRLGFRPYTRERIYTWSASSGPRVERPPHLQERTSDRLWLFSRLWHQVTPPLILAAETLAANSLNIPYAWADRPGQRIFIWAEGNTPWAALAIKRGKHAHWLRILAAPQAGDRLHLMIRWAIQQITHRSHRPVFAAVREYQQEEQQALLDLGFTLHDERTLVIKHLALPLNADERVPESILALAGVGGEPAYSSSWEGGRAIVHPAQTFPRPPTYIENG